MTVKVLFVCLGNICRSPIAESLLRKKVQAAGLTSEIFIESRATSHFNEGKEPYYKTKEILDKYQVDYSGIYSQQIQTADFENFDLIIAMDEQNSLDLKQVAPREYHDRIQICLAVLPDVIDKNVPDPYYTDDFEYSYQLIDRATSAWLVELRHALVNKK